MAESRLRTSAREVADELMLLRSALDLEAQALLQLEFLFIKYAEAADCNDCLRQIHRSLARAQKRYFREAKRKYKNKGGIK